MIADEFAASLEGLMVNIERDIGRLEAVARNLEHQIIELKRERDEMRARMEEVERALQKKITDEMAEVKELISQFRGGYRVILWVGALISGIGGSALLKFALPWIVR